MFTSRCGGTSVWRRRLWLQQRLVAARLPRPAHCCQASGGSLLRSAGRLAGIASRGSGPLDHCTHRGTIGQPSLGERLNYFISNLRRRSRL